MRSSNALPLLVAIEVDLADLQTFRPFLSCSIARVRVRACVHV